MATNVKRKKKAEVMSDDGSMTLTGHLKELRNRLIICAAVFVVGVIGFLAISDKLIDLLTAMAMNANYTFVFLAPQEKLMQYQAQVEAYRTALDTGMRQHQEDIRHRMSLYIEKLKGFHHWRNWGRDTLMHPIRMEERSCRQQMSA